VKTTDILESIERTSVAYLREDSIHDGQVALMKFLSSAAKKVGVGKHVYVVGGAVRDFVIGYPIKDVDVVVDAVALDGKDSEWFAKQLQKQIPVKTSLATNQYGVAILSVAGKWDLDGNPMGGSVIEIANARKESYGGKDGKGYKPTKVSLASIEDDTYRREFTFNTLMWRLSDLARGPEKAEIIDITGRGLSDLKAGEMKCPSDPDKTFSDDPTRMLRAVKFLVRYKWKISDDVARSIQRNASKLMQVPYEAIVSLLVKDILKESTYKKALEEMKRLGLLTVVSEMMKTNPSMAASMNKWSTNMKVRHLFDMLDAGIPIGKRIGFLTKDQQDRLRLISVSHPVDFTETLLDILKQPGTAMKTDQLIRELGLKGSQIKELTHVAREVLLARPNLVGSALVHHTGSDMYTNAVRAAAKERGLGESEMFDVHFQVLTEAGADLEVHVYDFDNTLFKSPMKPEWWSSKRQWWSDPSSLSPPCVPKNPGSDWWNTKTVADARNSIRNPDVFAVLMTGRHDRLFRWRVPELLKQAGLDFDSVHLAPGKDSTLQWKLGMMKKILSRFSSVKTVQIWEDRDHIDDFVRFSERLGFVTAPHRVTESTKEADCTEQEWKDVWE